MKTTVILTVSIVSVCIFFCPVVMAAPAMPSDLQMVPPDPSLPKELSAFFGKWEKPASQTGLFIIIEKIDQEKANLYILRDGLWPEGTATGWQRVEANVIKERGKYKLYYSGPYGVSTLTLAGEYLTTSGSGPYAAGYRLKRVE